jgi:outer membrane protein OmpA-like peptidoglycan-associated protein
VRIKKIAVSACICFVIAATYALAQNDVAAQPAPEQTAAPVVAAAEDAEAAVILNFPATSYWGIRGLSQTVSAEPMNEGRLNIAISASYFNQFQSISKPEKGTNVGLGRLVGAYGLNSTMDIFGYVPMNIVDEVKNFKLGELAIGGQWSFLPKDWLFKAAVQAQLVWGLSKNDTITYNPSNPLAGYDFFETRGTIDVATKLIQSVVLYGQNQKSAVKIHANEGIYYIPSENDWLMLGALGLQIDPIDFITLGFELNTRTTFEDFKIQGYPLWFTPSVMYRSPWNFGVLAGIDLNMSRTKTRPKPLEPWRVFGDIIISFDLNASKREAEARRAKEEAAEKARLEAETQRLAAEKESLTQKAVEDSIRAAQEMARRAEADSLRTKAIADSLANLVNAISQKARADSIAHAESSKQLLANAEAKRVADSLALVEAQKKLSDERAKRTEAEQYLLTTGMLVLDAVYFTSGKADLHINSRPYLGTIAKMLVKYPKLKLEIGGHTDNIGRPETNMNLSQKRAEAVFLQMVNTEPSLAQMLTARGYGPTVPKANNATAAGRELNRRVELKVLNPEVLKDYNP